MCTRQKMSQDVFFFGLGKQGKALLHDNMTFAALNQAFHRGVIFTLLMALMMLSFGHRVHASHDPMDADMRAFLAAGGKISDICEDSDDGHDLLAECPVCTLAAGFALPNTGPTLLGAEDHFVLISSNPLPPETVLSALDHSRTSRAPPHA